MPQEILPDLYTIEVPLPANPLKATNVYVVRDGERSLIVDTGMDRDECMDALSSGLRELEVDLAKADFFITHLHADHSGLVARLATPTSKIYFGEADGTVVMEIEGKYFQQVPRMARMHGFPEDDIERALHGHPGYKYAAKQKIEFQAVGDEDRVGIGDYDFEVIETPGHTSGHVCMYEPRHKLFVAGDHVLGDITPNISHWSADDSGDPLKEYLASLEKVRDLDVELVLPGHRRLFKNYRERIDEIVAHHDERIDEVMSILESGSKSSYRVASQMSWAMKCDSWDDFPGPQKWFASGEALAHLRYLEGRGEIRRDVRGEAILFSLNT